LLFIFPNQKSVILSEAHFSGVEGPAFAFRSFPNQKSVILSEAYVSGVEGPAFAFRSDVQPDPSRHRHSNSSASPKLFPVAIPHILCNTYVVSAQERKMGESKLDLLQGTLDLMVLQTLAAMGAHARLRHRAPH
jgi:hypothetical protein